MVSSLSPSPGSAGPPPGLVRALIDGPSLVAGVEWHDEAGSTNTLAAAAAARGVPEMHVVLADRQSAGRGRLGRVWQAPGGSSLLLSVVLRPSVGPDVLPLLPLLAGTVLADVAVPFAGGGDVAVKWPNDLLVGGRKAAGILVESSADAVIVGIGVNVDWRKVQRPPELAHATSLAEAAGGDVDRWKLLAALLSLLSRRYGDWQQDSRAFLAEYRTRCATLGTLVRVTRVGQQAVEGVAVAVSDDGALVVRDDAGQDVVVRAGDVEHVRPR